MKSRQAIEAAKLVKLLAQGNFYCECPCGCDKEINLKNAGLFYNENPTPEAIEYKNSMSEYLKDLYASLKSKRLHKATHTESINKGFGVEKIVTELNDFKFEHGDCRSIFKPIDFLIFEGLSKRGRISKIFFVDVKSGGARLDPFQKQI